MRKDKKSRVTINRHIGFTKEFEKYLLMNKKKKIERAVSSDLEDYRQWGEENKIKNLRMHFKNLDRITGLLFLHVW